MQNFIQEVLEIRDKMACSDGLMMFQPFRHTPGSSCIVGMFYMNLLLHARSKYYIECLHNDLHVDGNAAL